MDTTKTTNSVTNDVAATHSRWWNALLAGDAVALEAFLADDMTLHSPFGTTQNKAGEVEALRSGSVHYTSIKDEEPVIRRHGQTGIVTGRADIEFQAGGQAGQARVYYTAVYGWTDPNWHMLAWQSTLRAEEQD
ncbi:nuclear transport factor 2 family protein [Dermatophilaceae bacterium Soc4.6]